jgi:putative transposase
LEVPRDRDGSFDPATVRKNQRRLDGVDSMVISLTAKGLTTGEVEAHLAEVYSTNISRETISKITDRVLGELADWQNRPLDRVYPVIFIDAIVVKIRDGQVANRPVYAAIGVTVDGQRDILGLWIGTGGEGAKYWLQVLTEIKNRGVDDACIVVCDGLKGLTRVDRGDLAVGDRANLCPAPDPQHLPPRQPQRLGQNGARSATRVHRRQRSRFRSEIG